MAFIPPVAALPRADARFHVAVIGGGVAGLAAAHTLSESAPDVDITVFEAASRAGGIVNSITRDGYLIERSADSFITQPPHALDLCRRLGLANELIPTASSGRRALVLHRGELVPVPEGFVIMSPTQLGPFVRSPLLSSGGKLRVLEEPLVPPRSVHLLDESVADFARRRFGREAYERLIQPLVGGIYTGDPQRLSMAATMPRFWDAERVHGSVLRAARAAGGDWSSGTNAQTSGARYGLFLSLRRGMNVLTDALAEALPAGSLKLGHRVVNLEQNQRGWSVECMTTSGPTAQAFDAVIVATPAKAAASILSGRLAETLQAIESAGASVVCLGYRREQVAHPLDAFGFVVPQIEGRHILAGSFLSTKFADRSPYNCILLRVFVGGALQPELVDLSDDELLQIVYRELHGLLGASGTPQVVDVARWHDAMPQYHVGHLQRIERIEQLVAELPGLALAGNAYRGVGIAQCVQSGEEAAGRVLDSLRRRQEVR
jgi:oxygen-dependent protoporphyrinogen oxidase